MVLHNYLQTFAHQLDLSISFTLGTHTLFMNVTSLLQLQWYRFNTKEVTGSRMFSYTKLYKAHTENGEKTFSVHSEKMADGDVGYS